MSGLAAQGGAFADRHAKDMAGEWLQYQVLQVVSGHRGKDENGKGPRARFGPHFGQNLAEIQSAFWQNLPKRRIFPACLRGPSAPPPAFAATLIDAWKVAGNIVLGLPIVKFGQPLRQSQKNISSQQLRWRRQG